MTKNKLQNLIEKREIQLLSLNILNATLEVSELDQQIKFSDIEILKVDEGNSGFQTLHLETSAYYKHISRLIALNKIDNEK